ncbi:TRAP transporter large permease [Thermosediminibacter litoriperuensis]|uniref:Tripartite ATP-independent transporter DctM subunit n=1 Tax=Thermosediminibacter litoriperuensis TaxID=291989 RepID=A0A5S5AQZ7_9FIRM|nr:TRAP transporter large permease [Thermosediminibacter litoriperuensis]TYP53235.1 tripartite ATP-independent transporter DctM subunit [Thermosediminibacter litoriperuensis]
MAILIIFIVMFFFMFLGLDIFISMAIAGSTYLLATGNGPLTMISNNMINGVSNVSLLAIPFFVLAGELMNISGMTDKLLDFSLFFIGRVKGALAHACIFVNAIFSLVSGSGPADAAAISPILLPKMKEEGYPEDFSAACNAAGAVLGPIIPPGIPMVFLGLITNLSIGRLFLGAMIPGILMAVFMSLIVALKVRNMKLKPHESKMSWEGFLKVLRDSWLPLLAPVIIFVGVFTGMATVTEVAILATAYVLFIGIFVYRKITLKGFFQAFKNTALFSASIMALFAVAGIFSYMIAVEQLGMQIVQLINQYHISPLMFLFLCNVLFLFLGMIMDATPAMLIFGPLLLPIATRMGIDPIHFGTVMICNLMIGLITPPVGALLFLLSKISGLPFERVTKASLPFAIALLIVQALITVFPGLVTYLPNLVFGG